VKHVLTAMTIFQLLVIDPPIWLDKAIDRLCRGFLWNNDEIAQGGKCLVSWVSVCRPIEFGGLGNLDLLAKGVALRVRWLWQQWTETEKSWQGLPIAVDSRAGALFNAAVQFFLGNGLRISFWHDPWFEGRSIAAIAPALFQHCTKRNIPLGLALQGNKWIRHFKSSMSQEAPQQFIYLFDRLATVQLSPNEADKIAWKWTTNGEYSAVCTVGVHNTI
jgi:hypothetical protein